jgi:hypothetical protein
VPLQKRSHLHLAKALMHRSRPFGPRRFELAFLLGSVQPDCNPLSYIKGSFSARAFQGHCYSNSAPYIASRMARLRRRRRWTLWQYYTLGKLTHYLADAFTFPHNDTYTDSLQAHRRYEAALRQTLPLRLSGIRSSSAAPRDPAAALERLHRRYLAAASDLQRDIDYILEATSLLMVSLLPEQAFAGNRYP